MAECVTRVRIHAREITNVPPFVWVSGKPESDEVHVRGLVFPVDERTFFAMSHVILNVSEADLAALVLTGVPYDVWGAYNVNGAAFSEWWVPA